MKPLAWNPDKNELLKQERNISFEDVRESILAGRVFAIEAHPNQEKYPHQQIITVEIRGYAYLVPFVESENELFLKTVIPSRKATKKYLTSNS
ncbi:MAG: DUF4258 domain-containing protein [Candidatus Kapaibacteriota bacterium]|jgi:uncharacterized DUF497 family protein